MTHNQAQTTAPTILRQFFGFDSLDCEACGSSAGNLRLVHQCRIDWCAEVHVATLCIACRHFAIGTSHEQPRGYRTALREAALDALREAQP